MGLKEYARKRRFDVTAEPPPKTERQTEGRRRGAPLRFVVQKHCASRLHYDFRLEWNGVLLSWAVPKGPSTDPSNKRLAMEVEDHPLDYADFEGIIPRGQYGGGTVMVWDRGTYMPAAPDVGAAHRAGRLEFALQGKKLTGNWILVRTRGSKGTDRRSWLLIKRHDDAASDADVVLEKPRSIKSRRLMAEIAFDEGGEVERAASSDPPEAIRALLHNPRTRRRKPHSAPSVWTSK
jgi:bifunctional non-homologous end joining protein LigD